MSTLGILVDSIATIFHQVISIYIWIIIIAALVSWVKPDPYNPIIQILNRLTQPAYSFVKRFIPTFYSGIDFAPIIILLILQFIDLFIIRVLSNFAHTL